MESSEALIEAMKQEKSALQRHLAFHDLVRLSADSKQRREDLFKLSQPGGHPRNWDGVSSVAIKVGYRVFYRQFKMHIMSMTTLGGTMATYSGYPIIVPR